uniref:Uncharacterized protein n=1 Tax=Anguilla anguilla TaxID=7936 RepID=A0A0E9QNR8_ANGAN
MLLGGETGPGKRVTIKVFCQD